MLPNPVNKYKIHKLRQSRVASFITKYFLLNILLKTTKYFMTRKKNTKHFIKILRILKLNIRTCITSWKRNKLKWIEKGKESPKLSVFRY